MSPQTIINSHHEYYKSYAKLLARRSDMRVLSILKPAWTDQQRFRSGSAASASHGWSCCLNYGVIPAKQGWLGSTESLDAGRYVDARAREPEWASQQCRHQRDISILPIYRKELLSMDHAMPSYRVQCTDRCLMASVRTGVPT